MNCISAIPTINLCAAIRLSISRRFRNNARMRGEKLTAELVLERLPGRYTICRLSPEAPIPPWAQGSGGFISITRTDLELSIVAAEAVVPVKIRADHGWVGWRIAGQLDLSLVGVMARLCGVLAEAGVPVFVISTYDTDILLVKAGDEIRARKTLTTVAQFQSH